MKARRLIRRTSQFIAVAIPSLLLLACHDHPAEGVRESGEGTVAIGVAERGLDAELRSLASRRLTVAERVEHFARESLGQPYKLGLLGEYPVELFDSDPLYDLSASDCVTFVEQTYAKALAQDWTFFFNILMRIRYKDGRIGMLTRNHFTEADWNPNNAWLFEDVTDGVAGGKTRPMRVVVDRATFFAKYEIGQGIPVQVVESTYIPREEIAAADAKLETGDVVEFVRGTREKPYIGHLGLIVGRVGGKANLIHSGTPCVNELPLLDYLKRYPKILGIKVLRCRIHFPLES